MKKVQDTLRRQGIGSTTHDMEHFLNLVAEVHASGLIRKMSQIAKQREDINRRAPGMVVTSDMRRNVLSMQRHDQEQERQRLLQAEKQRAQVGCPKAAVACLWILETGSTWEVFILSSSQMAEAMKGLVLQGLNGCTAEVLREEKGMMEGPDLVRERVAPDSREHSWLS